MQCIAVFQRKLGGYVHFRQKSSKDEVIITVNVSKLSNGEHGFHIHKFGDLLKTDCKSCGGHFNPFGKKHGGLDDTESHAGDLGNIVSVNRHCETIIKTKKITLYGKHSVVGRSVVIHSGCDDLGRGGNKESEKTGNSGSRLDCAVIGLTNSKRVS